MRALPARGVDPRGVLVREEGVRRRDSLIATERRRSRCGSLASKQKWTAIEMRSARKAGPRTKAKQRMAPMLRSLLRHTGAGGMGVQTG